MPKRTQIVCMHEGKKGRSVDPIFISAFVRAYTPDWIRPWTSSGVRLIGCGSKSELLKQFPDELNRCHSFGGDTTLVILADMDDKIENGEQLKQKYWAGAEAAGIAKEIFDKVVFIFPKDRIENWVEFLLTGNTDENHEGRRIVDFSKVRDAAKLLAEKCRIGSNSGDLFPTSLKWSCRNWRTLVERMR